jgi:peptide-methionine (S)-S-oxide reductase
VVETSVGYSGGTLEHPTYEDVCGGRTGHTEVVEVRYDPARTSLDAILEAFWEAHDPTESGKGQYGSVIFYTTPEQQAIAEAAKARLQASGRFERPIATAIKQAGPYWRAEDYHQRFYEKKFGPAAARGW